MASHDSTSENSTKLRKFLNLLMAACSVVLGMLAFLTGAAAMLERGGGFRLSNPFVGFCVACIMGAIVLARLSRLRPMHMIGYASVGGLLLSVLLLWPTHGDRVASPQASAVSALRTLNTAEITYDSTFSNGYSPTMSCLGQPVSGNPTPTAAGLIDSILAGTGNTSERSGYRFVYSPGPRDERGRISSYSITAGPIQPGVTGTNYYYTDQTGVIRQNATAPASATDSPVAG